MNEKRDAVAEFACGEIRTCLLQTSASLAARTTAQLLQLRPDSWVRLSERPNLYAASPDILTGVDCRMPSASGGRVRGVGTVRSRAVLTEGRVLQAGAYFRTLPADADHRRPWGHYLVHPGVVEPLGRLSPRDAADGFLSLKPPPDGTIDPGAIAERLLSDLRAHRLLDRRPPFKSAPTKLRWAAVRSDDGPAIDHFTVADDGVRTVALRLPDLDDTAVVALCEDLALHDWLLTTLVRMVERSRLGSTPGAEAVVALRPAVDHLLHLWMPKARVAPHVAALWDELEREPGFSRQWRILVQRIRDQLALQAIPLMRESRETQETRQARETRETRGTRETLKPG